MDMDKIKTILGSLLLLLVSVQVSATPIGTLDQSNYASAYTVDTGFNASSAWRAQTFTVGTSGQLTHIGVDIYTRQRGSGSILLDLLSTSTTAVPTSIVLASGSLPDSSIPSSISEHGFVTFDLTASSLNVTQGDVFAIALRTSTDLLMGGWVGSNTNYAGGEFYYNFPTNSNGWVVNQPAEEYDLYFNTYINSASQVPEPSIIALFTLGLFGIGFARRRQQS
jgi:hypothetical protein